MRAMFDLSGLDGLLIVLAPFLVAGVPIICGLAVMLLVMRQDLNKSDD